MRNETEWKEVWEAMSDEALRHAAIVRVMECSNGTIQYAFRGNDPRALSTEQTREAMKLSMGVMKTRALPVGGGMPLTPEISDVMAEMRHLYVRGFKEHDEAAFNEFMTASVANVRAIGRERMDDAEAFVREHFTDIFTSEFITHGRAYLDNLVTVEELAH